MFGMVLEHNGLTLETFKDQLELLVIQDQQDQRELLERLDQLVQQELLVTLVRLVQLVTLVLLDQLVTRDQQDLPVQYQPSHQQFRDQLVQLVQLVHGLTHQHRQVHLPQEMLGLTLLQAEYLSFMMDTGSRQAQLQSVLQDRKVLLDQ
jgi:hypothetical protein